MAIKTEGLIERALLAYPTRYCRRVTLPSPPHFVHKYLSNGLLWHFGQSINSTVAATMKNATSMIASNATAIQVAELDFLSCICLIPCVTYYGFDS